MKPSAIVLALALGVSAGSLSAQDASAPPPGERPPPPEGGGQGGQQPRPGGPRLLPPGAQETLKLTTEQQKQLADLEADIKTKLEKILTPEQLAKFKQLRPPQRPGAPPTGARPAGGTGAPAGDQAGQAPPPRPPAEE